MDYPDIISKIDRKYPIILSAKVTDEPDKMKIKLTEERRQNAEKALRNLNNESQHEILYEFADTSLLPDDFDKRSPDNMILSVALKYKEQNPIMLTSDNGLQLKSKLLGITTISLKKFLKNNLR
ncbi:MAG: PIN domain-containing protein [Bacteroides graminisolvens]|nr:PIN domain-containing protein [Bacteroides graminisolvens]